MSPLALSTLFALLVYCATLSAPPAHRPREVCHGAMYFYSGPPPAWAKGKHVVCRVGPHTFLN